MCVKLLSSLHWFQGMSYSVAFGETNGIKVECKATATDPGKKLVSFCKAAALMHDKMELCNCKGQSKCLGRTQLGCINSEIYHSVPLMYYVLTVITACGFAQERPSE